MLKVMTEDTSVPSESGAKISLRRVRRGSRRFLAKASALPLSLLLLHLALVAMVAWSVVMSAPVYG